jgi:hypothetical protein
MSQSGQCIGCKHYTMSATCDAFPEKIPHKIFSGQLVHTKPYPGDQGILYDPILPETEDDEDEFEAKSVMAPSALDKLQFLDLSGVQKEKARDYKEEYRSYHGRPKQIKERAQRNAARSKLGLKRGDPREVDHKHAISDGGSNSKRNLRAVSRETNRKKGDKQE